MMAETGILKESLSKMQRESLVLNLFLFSVNIHLRIFFPPMIFRERVREKGGRREGEKHR